MALQSPLDCTPSKGLPRLSPQCGRSVVLYKSWLIQRSECGFRLLPPNGMQELAPVNQQMKRPRFGCLASIGLARSGRLKIHRTEI